MASEGSHSNAWPSFSISRLPRILFGAGRSMELPAIARAFGPRALVVTRAPGFTDGPDWARLGAALRDGGVEVETEGVSGEP
ncbi:MAG: hypothetical protein ACXWN4_05040, partial [Candidatus Limnocylindrales bacterium]